MIEEENGRFMTTEERLDMPAIEEHIDFYYKEEDLKVSAHFSDIKFELNEFNETVAITEIPFEEKQVKLEKVLTMDDIKRLAESGINPK